MGRGGGDEREACVTGASPPLINHITRERRARDARRGKRPTGAPRRVEIANARALMTPLHNIAVIIFIYTRPRYAVD